MPTRSNIRGNPMNPPISWVGGKRFEVDTSVKFNFMSSYYAVNSAVNMTKGIAKAVRK